MEAARDARIVIMNPPFTNRTKMGEKFPKDVQLKLRSRVDLMERILVKSDMEMNDFVDKNSIAPLFVGLADRCLSEKGGEVSITMVHPTIALSNTSGKQERRILAQRYHIDTVVTCHQPGNVNLSQGVGVNESIIVAKRHSGPKPPTRFIRLDKFPVDEVEVDDLHRCLLECSDREIGNGWGEVSFWPADLMAVGDWTPAIWRSPELAKVAAEFANHDDLKVLSDFKGFVVHKTGATIYGLFEKTDRSIRGSFPAIGSKGAEGQKTIQSTPDEYWIPKERDDDVLRNNGGTYPEAE